MSERTDYLDATAEAVERQALANPGLGIPADPDVAAHMGAFMETALTEDDMDENEGE